MIRVIPRLIFELVFLRPITLLVVGLRLKHPERLPKKGPALLVANHNSHLDTPVLFSLFSLGRVHRVCAVAAHDYWFGNPLLALFTKYVMNLVPVKRKREEGESVEDILANVFKALEENKIVIFFPEGSRGEPEQRSTIRSGIDVICSKFPNLKVCPVFLHGLGKVMPRGDPIVVPFFCDVVVGEPITGHNDEKPSKKIAAIFDELEKEVDRPLWH